MDAEQRERLLDNLLEFDEPNSQMVDGYDYNWEKALDFIQQEIAKARIDEIHRYDHMTYHSRDEFEAYIQQRQAELSQTLKEHKEE